MIGKNLHFHRNTADFWCYIACMCPPPKIVDFCSNYSLILLNLDDEKNTLSTKLTFSTKNLFQPLEYDLIHS